MSSPLGCRAADGDLVTSCPESRNRSAIQVLSFSKSTTGRERLLLVKDAWEVCTDAGAVVALLWLPCSPLGRGQNIASSNNLCYYKTLSYNST